MMMLRPRRAALLGTFTLALALAAPAAAQDEPVPYLDAEGTELGTIAIREMADPYTEFEPTRPPAEGQRYALLTVTFEAAEDQTFPTDPRQIQLQDSRGYLHFPTSVPRPAEATVPELQSQVLAPFDRVSGVVGYVLPADADIVRILYRGDGSRLMPIAAPGSTGAVAITEAQTLTDAAGTPLGSITVREMADPYTDFDPSWPPAEGQRYVLLTMAFEAAEDQAMYADPRVVHLVDSNGAVYRPIQVPRPAGELLQNLDIQPLSPTDRISGVIGYQVPADAVLDSIVYESEGNRFVPIADVAGEPAPEVDAAAETD
jgi:hypothetical protein